MTKKSDRNLYDNQTLVSMDISGEQQLKVENEEGEDLAT